MTKKDIPNDGASQITDAANPSAMGMDPNLNEPSSAPPDVIIAPMPTFREKLEKIVADSLVRIHKWKETLQQTITCTIQYSPVRFTNGLTPVRISFSGWGFCVYNSKIRHFHNSDVTLKIPVNTQTPLIIFGWRTLFKHSLFIDSSIKTIRNFSVESNAQYAVPKLPKAKLKCPKLTVTLRAKTIRVPSSPVFRVNKEILGEVHRELSKKEDR